MVANPKTIINSRYAKKEIKEHIIKHDQLINKMKELAYANRDGYWFTEEKMYSIAHTLLKYNSKYTFDYNKKYGSSLYSSKCNDIQSYEEEIQLSNKDSIDEEPIEETPLYKELRKVNGFGNVKCERYGKDIVEIVNKNC